MKKAFAEVWNLIRELAKLNDAGPAYESFRTSVIFEFTEEGYSEERAGQVVDELVAVAKRVPTS